MPSDEYTSMFLKAILCMDWLLPARNPFLSVVLVPTVYRLTRSNSTHCYILTINSVRGSLVPIAEHFLNTREVVLMARSSPVQFSW